MELRHLKYFVAVAEELHFGRAAEKLHIAQPPLSQQIKSLEEELGVELFSRTRRKVELTPAGRLFLDEARRTLEQAERAQRVAVEAGKGIRGRLRVGFVTSASYSILPSVIRRFRLENPGVDLELFEQTPCEQLNALEQGEIDIGLLRPPVEHTCMKLTTVFAEPLLAALPKTHQLAGQKTVDLKKLSEDAFVLFPRQHGPGIYDVVMRTCHEAGFVPHVSYSPNAMQTILAYVAGGLGISLVPQSLRGFHSGSIDYIPLRGNRFLVELALLCKGTDQDILTQKFTEICSEVGDEFAAISTPSKSAGKSSSR